MNTYLEHVSTLGLRLCVHFLLRRQGSLPQGPGLYCSWVDLGLWPQGRLWWLAGSEFLLLHPELDVSLNLVSLSPQVLLAKINNKLRIRTSSLTVICSDCLLHDSLIKLTLGQLSSVWYNILMLISEFERIVFDKFQSLPPYSQMFKHYKIIQI